MSKFICGICTVTSAILGTVGIIGAVTAPAVASPTCMTMDEARKAYPRDHIYWHGPQHCWDNIGKKREQEPVAKTEPSVSQPKAAAIDKPSVSQSKSAATEKPNAPVTVPPVRFFAGDPTASLFWPIHDAPVRLQQSDPLPPAPPPVAQEVADQDDIVIGAPNAAPGSPAYLLDHCCWPPSLSHGTRDAGVLRNMIIASTSASGVAIGLWLLVQRRRRTVRVRWS